MEFTDQIGQKLILNDFPKRIISTVPSLTEFIIDLGITEELIGVTKFCIHPKSITKKIEKIGGTKALDIPVIKGLKPDLIICNKEENVKEQILELQKSTNVLVTNIVDFKTALAAMSLIGEVLGKENKAKEIIEIIEFKKANFQRPTSNLKVAYLIWKDPYMTIGGDTYINSMLDIAGYQNVFANRQRYPKISLPQIKSQQPDIVFLSSEPYPFKEKHVKEIQEYVESDIVLVDGELFSWYGSRMVFAFKYFEELKQVFHS